MTHIAASVPAPAPQAPDLATFSSALDQTDVALASLTRQLARAVVDPQRPGTESPELLHRYGAESLLLARLLAEASAARTLLQTFAGAGVPQQQLARYAAAQTVLGIEAALVREGVWFCGGIEPLRLEPAVRTALGTAVDAAAVEALATWALDGGGQSPASYGLSRDHAEVRGLFREFADSSVASVAERIHRHDEVLPEELLSSYAEIGALGITIPESYGGHFVDHRSMALATEELSRASLGAGGSVITRPEICAKALLKGGTEEQKRKWLPRIASGQEVVAIAVTEPGAGSDVAALRLTAQKVEGGWLLNGEKTWCTFAGRASVMLVLARTGTPESKAKGLTLFLVPKDPVAPPLDDRHFVTKQPTDPATGRGGGQVSGRAIPTVGYRGMHSFTVFFEKYFVPDDCRVGNEGEGFALQMAGFAGGRIQTAARAVGVMEAAFRSALTYVKERQVFGRTLASLPLVRRKLVDMAAKVALSRQMTYAVCDRMDAGQGEGDASLVKLLACKDAEWVTREAMQLHGGMGYSEEYAVSRYWQDARVLSIFEGAEEVLGVMVIARAAVREVLAQAEG